MSKIIIIRGNAASGKSSLAQALQEELGDNTLLLSQDLLRRTMLHAHDGRETPTIDLLLHLIAYGHKHCHITILEGILRSDWYQPIWDCIRAHYTPANTHAYYYDLPFSETVRRHASRDKAKAFGEEALKRWWVAKDYLTSIPETRLTQDLSLDKAKAIILADIKKP